ncbi:hypothetical protein [Glycomyces sp. NPDC048151]|uniref:hypothetical protein n=1 Tax=Glycomyces sp. NPDC048151 TaxID=3364002 RepID=UPI00371912BF
MASWIIPIVLVLAVLAFFGWKFYQGWAGGAEVVASVEPLPMHQYQTVLELPSSLPALKFKCPVTVEYIVKGDIRIGEDVRRVLEWELHRTAQAVTAQHALTVSEYLHLPLNDKFNAWRWARDGAIGFKAEFGPALVEPEDLALARELERAEFTLDMETRLHDKRMSNADRLGRLLSEPRTAALWWFAQHPERVEELPRITEMMFALDAQLNHRGAVLSPGIVAVGDFAPTSGADLDSFLTGTGEDNRTLLLNTLAAAYDRLGSPEMAERARDLAEPAGPNDEAANSIR